jgi:hypothetical protein
VPFFLGSSQCNHDPRRLLAPEARHRGGCAKVGEFLATDLSTTSGTVTPTDGGLVRGKPRRTVNTWREAFWLGD